MKYANVPSFSSISTNILTHVNRIQNEYDRLFYGGKNLLRVKPHDRSNFYLDDDLPWQIDQNIGGNNDCVVKKDLILLNSIGGSRIFSWSLAIQHLHNLRQYLKFDQLVELAFVVTLQNHPLWFDHVMSIVKDSLQKGHSFSFSQHPFFDWYDLTVLHFGAPFGGPYQRWSPFGGNLFDLFGAGCTPEHPNRQGGEQRLKALSEVLIGFIDKVNGMAGRGDSPIVDMPMATLKEMSTNVCRKIKSIVPVQIQNFRLGFFLTICIGAGFLEPGTHLRQLFFPVEGSASYRHLVDPLGTNCLRTLACDELLLDNNLAITASTVPDDNLEEKKQDEVMECLSVAMNLPKYYRDYIEGFLVSVSYDDGFCMVD